MFQNGSGCCGSWGNLGRRSVCSLASVGGRGRSLWTDLNVDAHPSGPWRRAREGLGGPGSPVSLGGAGASRAGPGGLPEVQRLPEWGGGPEASGGCSPLCTLGKGVLLPKGIRVDLEVLPQGRGFQRSCGPLQTRGEMRTVMCIFPGSSVCICKVLVPRAGRDHWSNGGHTARAAGISGVSWALAQGWGGGQGRESGLERQPPPTPDEMPGPVHEMVCGQTRARWLSKRSSSLFSRNSSGAKRGCMCPQTHLPLRCQK